MARSSRGRRLLLVSSQILFLEALRASSALGKLFAPIDAAATTAAAYSLAMRQPRLIVVDRLMPGQPLRKVLAQLRRRAPESRLVALADFPSPPLVADAARAGAAGVITRGMPLRQALAVLRKVAAGGTSYPAPVSARAEARAGAGAKGVADLTAREVDVLLCLARAMSLLECAQHLGLSRNTVDNHRTRLMAKLGVHRTVELPWIVLREGLLSLW